MRKGFKELQRKLGRMIEEFKASKEISSFTSMSEGLEVLRAKFDIQVMCRNGFKEPLP